MTATRSVVLLSLALVFARGPLPAQSREDFENPPVSYSTTAPDAAAKKLEARLASGALTLAGLDKAIVATLLREFRVPISSQVVVFSKTSLQRGRINPDHPRALYFSDDCYIGWVPGGLVEITTIDPVLGPVFYTFDPQRRPGGGDQGLRFERESDCLRSHGGAFVREVPAVFVRSVFPDLRGEPLLRHGSLVVDHRTPFEQRWGGWYVTGRHGAALQRGNVLGREENHQLILEPAKGANVTDLASRFDVSRYLAPASDIVALLVLDHQTTMQNAITHAAFAARRMLDYQRNLQRSFNEPETREPAYDSVKSVFESETRAVVDALLFKDEAVLPAGVQGAAEFAREFQASAPRDPRGESLKTLSRDGRIFRNRCSYLIYSEQFLRLPAPLKSRICARLTRALSPDQPDPRYAYLDAAERARITQILRATHPELRDL
jgi:hypothetical protein